MRLLTDLLESDSRLPFFGNSAYPENWVLFYEALSLLATKKNGCSQGNFTSLSTFNKMFLSTFNFIPKINGFLSKISPISISQNINDTEHLISRNLHV